MSQQTYIFFFFRIKRYIFYWDIKHRAVGPCLSRATGHGGGPGTARCLGPCRAVLGSCRAVPCPGWAKMSGRGPGQRATGCMANYTKAITKKLY
jgi:hypothetical protein